MLTVLAKFLFFCVEQPLMTSVDDDAEEEGPMLMLPGVLALTSTCMRFGEIDILPVVFLEAGLLA